LPRSANARLTVSIGANDPYFNSQRALVIAPAVQLRLPAIYEWREYAEAGGLMSYGTSLTEAYRQASYFVVRILIWCKTCRLACAAIQQI
jgi:putative tryptophan/tyrosine transport system substrate-binding protein